MPVDYKFTEEKQGVMIAASGHVLGEDLIITMEQIFKDDNLTRNYKYGICDFSRIEKFDISHDQIFLMSKIHLRAAKLNRKITVGFAINKPFIYGLVGMWMVAATMTGWKVHVESDFEEIKYWINKQYTEKDQI